MAWPGSGPTRLPLGRLWLTKAGFHLALAAAAGLVLLIPLVAAHPAQPFHTRLLARENLREELPRFLLLSLVYGFAVGHLAGMLFRKAAVAGLVASVVSATMLALIYPSVIAGGAAAWQVWGPAGVLLLTARLLLYPWATERVTYRGPVLRAVGGTALAVGLLGAGLAYRVYEIPDVSDRLAESGFLASLPSFEENKGGNDVKSAVSQFRRAADSAEADYPRGRDPAAGRRPERFGADRQDPLDQVGAPAGRRSPGPWTSGSTACLPTAGSSSSTAWTAGRPACSMTRGPEPGSPRRTPSRTFTSWASPCGRGACRSWRPGTRTRTPGCCGAGWRPPGPPATRAGGD